MKKVCLLLMLAFAAVSCTNNDEESEAKPLASDLVGKWYFDSTALQDQVSDYTNACSSTRDFIELQQDEKTTVTKGKADCTVTTDTSGTWMLADYNLTLNTTDAAAFLQGQYRIQQLSQHNLTLRKQVTSNGSSHYDYYYLTR